MSLLDNVIYTCGAGFLILKTLQFVKFFYVHFIRNWCSKDLSKLGEWSVVTGATSGIGKGIALELARKGQNIVLVSRNMDKLEAVKKEVEDLGVEAKVVKVDFSDFDDAAKDRVVETCSPLKIGVLVNNA